MASESEWHFGEGDHRLVAVPTATTSVVFNMASSLTSSSDTETNKYFDQLARSVPQFSLVADQDTLITHINGVALTDGIPVDGNKEYAEKDGFYKNITVKTLVANTNISLRVR